jgi:hypothetical protein
MVQMVGVIVLALGITAMFASIDRRGPLDVGLMVLGYVVMRVPMIFLWSLVARHDPARAPAAHTYIATIAVAQLGWVGLTLLRLPVVMFLRKRAVRRRAGRSRAGTAPLPHAVARTPYRGAARPAGDQSAAFITGLPLPRAACEQSAQSIGRPAPAPPSRSPSSDRGRR